QTRYGLAVGLISSDAAQFDQLADAGGAEGADRSRPTLPGRSRRPANGGLLPAVADHHALRPRGRRALCADADYRHDADRPGGVCRHPGRE
ncbi:hypothetical protein FK521_27215, partial [Klebsiella pneumoniae]|nr:hypothetical protein [Klebsiella pneumoniae]